MSKLSVTYNIHYDILLESVSEIQSYAHNLIHQFRLIGIHMEHWSVYYVPDVCTVQGRPLVLGSCGEPDLVVHHNMHHPTY